LAGIAFAAGVFGFGALDKGALNKGALDKAFDDVLPEGVFPPGDLDAPAGLGAAGRARRPLLIFRTRFIMAPVT